MNDMLSVESPKHQPRIEQSLVTGNCLKAADAIVIDSLKKTPREKAREVLRFSAQKAALTASGLYLLLSSGCGNIEMPFSGSGPEAEPTRASASSDFLFSELGRKPYMEITSPVVDLAVTTKLKKAGVERILVDNDSRMPIDEEFKEIEIALSLAPYCSMLAPQLFFTDRGIFSKNYTKFYGGSANFPRTIKIIMPSEAVNLDEPAQDDLNYKGALTNKEFLRLVFLHECEHKIDWLIFDYFNSNNLKKGNTPYEHDDLSNGSRLSQDLHPFYRAFAEMKGLRLVRGSWVNLYFIGKKYEILDERFGEYITHDIGEYLAELFAISRLRPEMLTDKERNFFDRLHNGLMLKGQGFLADVAENPRLLLVDRP